MSDSGDLVGGGGLELSFVPNLGSRVKETLKKTDEMLNAQNKAALEYARKYPRVTQLWLCFYPYTSVTEPCCNSGPILPPFTVKYWSFHFPPWSDAYGQGLYFPLACTQFYSDLAPYGFLTPCPCWAEYFPFAPTTLTTFALGKTPGRRSFGGFHPLGSWFDFDGDADEYAEHRRLLPTPDPQDDMQIAESYMEGEETNVALLGERGFRAVGNEGKRIFVAPASHVYDARLVEVLHTMSDQGIFVRSAALFTSTPTQFRLVGLEPSSATWQHMGLVLESSHPVHSFGGVWRYLTLEMMSQGMMWTLSPAVLQDGYDYQKLFNLSFDALSFRHIARYLSRHKKDTYKVGFVDCQTESIQLFRTLQAHGKSVRDVVYASLVVSAGLSLDVVKTRLGASLFAGADTAGTLHPNINLELLEPSCPGLFPDALPEMSDSARAAWEACAEPLQLMQATVSIATGNGDDVMLAMQTAAHVNRLSSAAGTLMITPVSMNRLWVHGPQSATDANFHDGHVLSIRFFVTMFAMLSLLAFPIYLYRRSKAALAFERTPIFKQHGRKICYAVVCVFTVGSVFSLVAMLYGAWCLKKHLKTLTAPVIRPAEIQQGCEHQELLAKEEELQPEA